MNPIVEKIIMDVIKSLISEGTMEQAKEALLTFLKELAAKSPTELDDFAVDMLAKFLNAKVD